MPEYISPGGAFSNTLSDFLLDQEARKRQTLLDQLAQKRQSQADQRQDFDLRLRSQALQDQEEELHRKAFREDRTDFLNEVRQKYQPGDFYLPEDVAEAKRLGIQLPGGDRATSIPSASATTPAPGTNVDPMTGQATGQPPPAMPGAQPSMGIRLPGQYPGTPQQQTAIAKQQTQTKVDQALADGLLRGDDPRTLLATYLAQGGDPAKAEVIRKAVSPAQAPTPQVGTFGDYLSRLSNGDPSRLSPQDVEAARKKWTTEGRAEPKPEEGHFTTTQALDANGKPIPGQYIKTDTRTGDVSMSKVDPSVMGNSKAPPGASQIATKLESRHEASKELTRFDTAIDTADKAGALGPAAGRAATISQWIGDPDPATTALAIHMRLVRMLVDSGIGGMRAAASPQMLKQWDDVLNQKLTPQNLHTASKVLKEMVDDSEPPSTASRNKTSGLSAQELIDKYSK